MEYWLDLHMHSNVSDDGEISPEELMARCAGAKLRTVALTDHNSVRGIQRARRTSEKYQVQFISGIEISCQHQGQDLHLLGYGIDETKQSFTAIDQEVVSLYENAAAERIQRLEALGIKIDEEKLAALAVNGVVMLVMLAEAALADCRNQQHPLLLPYREGGSRSQNPYVSFSWDLCTQGKPAYVPIPFMSLTKAVAAIHAAGGIAVLAHPGANIGCNDELAESILRVGLEGIEVYNNYHDDQTALFYREKCRKHNILATVGSDFHGKVKPAIHLGEIGSENEAGLLAQLLAAIRNRQ